jgi:hypothetical protein
LASFLALHMSGFGLDDFTELTGSWQMARIATPVRNADLIFENLFLSFS